MALQHCPNGLLLKFPNNGHRSQNANLLICMRRITAILVLFPVSKFNLEPCNNQQVFEVPGSLSDVSVQLYPEKIG
jgi:hypothetical protein